MYIWTIIENKHCKKKTWSKFWLTWNSWPSIHFLKQFWGRFSDLDRSKDQFPTLCTIYTTLSTGVPIASELFLTVDPSSTLSDFIDILSAIIPNTSNWIHHIKPFLITTNLSHRSGKLERTREKKLPFSSFCHLVGRVSVGVRCALVRSNSKDVAICVTASYLRRICIAELRPVTAYFEIRDRNPPRRTLLLALPNAIDTTDVVDPRVPVRSNVLFRAHCRNIRSATTLRSSKSTTVDQWKITKHCVRDLFQLGSRP